MWHDRFVQPLMTDMDYNLPIFMHATGYLTSQYPINRPEGHPDFQWIHCTKGEGLLIVDGNKYTVKENQAILLYPNVPHQYYSTSDPWEVYWILLGGLKVSPIFELAGLHKSGVYNLSHSDFLLSHLKNAYSVAKAKNPFVVLECAKITYMLLLDIIRYSSAECTTIDQDYSRLQPVLEYVDNHYDQVITLEDLSEILGITSQYLCFLFKKLVNMRPTEYINMVRINKSKEILFHERDKKISDIAQMVGFENPGYFSTLFKKFEGMTPHAFKKLNGIS